jgi:hypothetical protein
MKTYRAMSISILVAVLALVGGCRPLSVELRLAPPQGETFRYHDNMTQELVMEIQGLEISLNQTMDITTRVDVIEVNPEGQVVVDVTYERLALEMMAPFTGLIQFDTEDETTTIPPEYQGIANMAGNTVTMTLDSRGSVLETSGFEELFGEVLGGTPSSQSELDNLLGGMTSLYDSGSNSGGLTGLIGSLPQGEITFGDSWTDKVANDATFPMTIEVVYSVVSIKDGEITIQMEGEIFANLEDFLSEFDLGDASIEMSGVQNGEIVLDIDTGMMIRSTQEINMTATAEFYVEDLGGEATVIYNIIQTYTRSLVEAE